MQISGKLVDILNRDIYPAIVSIKDSMIEQIKGINTSFDIFIIPGLIDSHIHIESFMMTQGAFAMTAIKHGV